MARVSQPFLKTEDDNSASEISYVSRMNRTPLDSNGEWIAPKTDSVNNRTLDEKLQKRRPCRFISIFLCLLIAVAFVVGILWAIRYYGGKVPKAENCTRFQYGSNQFEFSAFSPACNENRTILKLPKKFYNGTNPYLIQAQMRKGNFQLPFLEPFADVNKRGFEEGVVITLRADESLTTIEVVFNDFSETSTDEESLKAYKSYSDMVYRLPIIDHPDCVDAMCADASELLQMGFFTIMIPQNTKKSVDVYQGIKFDTNFYLSTNVIVLFDNDTVVSADIDFIFTELPTKLMTGRVTDSRIGYFQTSVKNYGLHDPAWTNSSLGKSSCTVQNKFYFKYDIKTEPWKTYNCVPSLSYMPYIDPTETFIQKWNFDRLPNYTLRLYIHESVPKRHWNSIIAGGDVWKTGLKAVNAQYNIEIIKPGVKDYPDHLDPADTRFSIITWNLTPTLPQTDFIVDPRTGEILRVVIRLSSAPFHWALQELQLFSPNYAYPTIHAEGLKNEDETEMPTISRNLGEMDGGEMSNYYSDFRKQNRNLQYLPQDVTDTDVDVLMDNIFSYKSVPNDTSGLKFLLSLGFSHSSTIGDKTKMKLPESYLESAQNSPYSNPHTMVHLSGQLETFRNIKSQFLEAENLITMNAYSNNQMNRVLYSLEDDADTLEKSATEIENSVVEQPVLRPSATPKPIPTNSTTPKPTTPKPTTPKPTTPKPTTPKPTTPKPTTPTPTTSKPTTPKPTTSTKPFKESSITYDHFFVISNLLYQRIQSAMSNVVKISFIHEMGHALGLSHNFKGSTLINYQDMYNVTYIDSHGSEQISSVMDHLPLRHIFVQDQDFNAYAFFDKLGSYDNLALTYGYHSLKNEVHGEKHPYLEYILEGKEIGYAGDTDGVEFYGSDPLANEFDLSSQPHLYFMAERDYVKELQNHLFDRSVYVRDNYDNFYSAQITIFSHVLMTQLKLLKYIGGIDTTNNRRGDQVCQNGICKGSLLNLSVTALERGSILDHLIESILDNDPQHSFWPVEKMESVIQRIGKEPLLPNIQRLRELGPKILVVALLQPSRLVALNNLQKYYGKQYFAQDTVHGAAYVISAVGTSILNKTNFIPQEFTTLQGFWYNHIVRLCNNYDGDVEVLYAAFDERERIHRLMQFRNGENV